jgi:hypothetical protein
VCVCRPRTGVAYSNRKMPLQLWVVRSPFGRSRIASWERTQERGQTNARFCARNERKVITPQSELWVRLNLTVNDNGYCHLEVTDKTNVKNRSEYYHHGFPRFLHAYFWIVWNKPRLFPHKCRLTVTLHNFSSWYDVISKFMAEWLALTVHIWEVPGWYLGRRSA